MQHKTLALLFMGLLTSSTASLALGSQAEPEFLVRSASFVDGGAMNQKYAGMVAGNPNCPGQNVSPELHWTQVPPGTHSLAAIIYDPDGRNGLGVTHWVAYGIDPKRTSFREGEIEHLLADGVAGKGTSGFQTYKGPCPPAGTGVHHYVFQIIATDLPTGALPEGLNREELLLKLEGHALRGSSIVGRFAHP